MVRVLVTITALAAVWNLANLVQVKSSGESMTGYRVGIPLWTMTLCGIAAGVVQWA